MQSFWKAHSGASVPIANGQFINEQPVNEQPANEQPANRQFANGQSAQVVQVRQKLDIPIALQTLGLYPRPTLVLIGGASCVSSSDADRIQRLFVEVLAPLVEELGAIVVDGGTNAGVMQLIGQARSTLSATFPLVGVSPIQLVHFSNSLSDQSGDRMGASTRSNPCSPVPTVALEPHHTHFILVPGGAWGDESSWLAWIASSLAGNHPSIAVLVNGGKVSLVDVQWNVAEGRPIVILAGSGRLADEIADAIRYPGSCGRETIASVVQSGCLSLLELSAPINELAASLRTRLRSSQQQIM